MFAERRKYCTDLNWRFIDNWRKGKIGSGYPAVLNGKPPKAGSPMQRMGMHNKRRWELVHVKKIQEGKSAMSNLPKYVRTCLVAAAVLLGGGFPALAAAGAPSLGTASNFAVLALSADPTSGVAVDCSYSVIDGDVAAAGSVEQHSNSSFPCTISGTIITPVAATTVSDFNNAYDQYPLLSCDPGGLSPSYENTTTLTLYPGVYCSNGDVSFNNVTLTLDAQGNPNATWIFKIRNDGTGGVGNLTATNFSVVMANGGQYSNVYWWTGGAVTINMTPDYQQATEFQGTILSGGDASIISTIGGPQGGATLFNGSVLAKGKVSLTNVTVTGINSYPATKSQSTCNQGVGNGAEGCDPGNSNYSMSPFGSKGSNDELGGVPGNPGRQGSSK